MGKLSELVKGVTIFTSIFLGITLAILLVLGRAQSPALPKTAPTPLSNEGELELYKKLSRSVVMVTDSYEIRSGGTGFYIGQSADNSSLVVTNSHVCGERDSSVVSFAKDAAKMLFKVKKQDPKADLCLLKGTQDVSLPLIPLKLAVVSPFYTAVYSAGHPFLRRLNPRKGVIVQAETVEIGTPMPLSGVCPEGAKEEEVFQLFFTQKICVEAFDSFYTTLESFPGNSGSPAVDANGDVVGVVFAIDNRTHYTSLVPLYKLKEFLKDAYGR